MAKTYIPTGSFDKLRRQAGDTGSVGMADPVASNDAKSPSQIWAILPLWKKKDILGSTNWGHPMFYMQSWNELPEKMKAHLNTLFTAHASEF